MLKLSIVSGPVLKMLRYSRKLWLRVALMALMALVASVSAMAFEDFLPQGLRTRFSHSAVMPVLTILASGMLAVSTFSLNVMVSAHRAAASQATPRAHRILLGDTTTQTVLATFIGAFVYALSAIILLQAGLNAEGSAVTLMGVTVLVVVLVILAMLRWIDHLSDLGSMDATLRATEAKAKSSLMQTRHAPALGATPLTAETVIPTDAVAIPAPASGYLEMIDLPRLQDALPDDAARLWMHIPPGQFVLNGQPVGHGAGLSSSDIEKVQSALTIGQFRTFEQDSTYGLLVLSEIASRALSPGINDPGTAIDVIARQERLIWAWANTPCATSGPAFPQVFIPEVAPGKLIESAFASTARDGAAMVEVVLRLVHALASLRDGPDPQLASAADAMIEHTRAHAEQALALASDKARIREAVAEGAGATPASP